MNREIPRFKPASFSPRLRPSESPLAPSHGNQHRSSHATGNPPTLSEPHGNRLRLGGTILVRAMSTPTREQLSPVADDLDGRSVVEHLLGKSVEEAVALLEENSAHYQHDYLQMGAEAFCFYCPALVRYLRSPAAQDDDGFAYSMLSTFRVRLERDGASILPAIPCIQEFCALVEADSERLGFDDDYANRARRRIAELTLRIESALAHDTKS
jgi:hypothetical protein